jgi:hypothetical protein
VWVPISSANTRREGSRPPSPPRQPDELVAFSGPYGPFFRLCERRLSVRQTWPRSPRPRTWHKGIRPSANGWPKGALGDSPRGASWPSRRASVSCRGPSKAPRWSARLAACSSVLRWLGERRNEGRSRPWVRPLFDRLDDLPSEVKRTCTHASTISGAPSSQSAV